MSASRSPELAGSLDELMVSLERQGWRALARFRLPPEDAEDVLQQTLLTFLHKRQEIYSPEAWVAGTIRKRCLMYWRRRRRSLVTVVDDTILEALAAPQSPHQDGDDLNRDLDRALETIPDRCRRLLELRYHQDCDPQEAAERLGYRSSGIYKILERCLAALTKGLVATGFLEERVCE